ncbi:MAG TPA: hypothetical protein VN783_17760 [Thermoanaerobaculia bacterium]|nr:hypothetical protein [Thermoanaerobaculia bacterium]
MPAMPCPGRHLCRRIALPIALFAAAWALSKPVAALPAGVAASGLRLVDRVVAVVDEDPILASDVDRVIGLGLEARKPGESDATLRFRVLDQLIEQRLRSHEIDRSGFVQVPVEQIEQQVEAIRGHFPDAAAFERKLAELGMDRAALAQLVARQLAVLSYVNDRLGPRVFVSLDDIRAYYQATLVPEIERRGEKPPPLEDVREQIRRVLHEQRLNAELDRWSEELRRTADVETFDDKDVERVPPLLKTIEAPGSPGAPGASGKP